MRYTLILLTVQLINTSYGMENSEATYGSITYHITTPRDSTCRSYCKKSITCIRLILPLLLVSIPPLVGFIASSITYNSNNSQNSEHHQRIGQLLQELLNAARTNGTA